MQKALFVQKTGEPVVLDTRLVPKPNEGQILIKITSTMILPHDTYGRDSGLFIGHKLPYILGTNVAGVVHALGDATSPYKTGDKVFGQASVDYPTPDMAGLQEYALLDVNATAKIPESLTADQLVTLPVNAVSSFLALFHSSGLGFAPPYPSQSSESKVAAAGASQQSIVIIGAGSNVGRFAIQFAKLAGVGIIVAVASGSRVAELKELGATHVLDRYEPQDVLASQAHDVVGGSEDITRVFDCANWTYELAVGMLATNRPSKLRTLHPIDFVPGTKSFIEQKRPNCDAAFIVGASEALEPLTKDFWKSLPDWVVKGHIALPPVRVIEGLDAEEINAALDGYRDGKAVLQVVVHPGA